MKGQAAIEYLMTYGWAILVVIIVGGALFALGIFDTSSFTGNRCTGFSQFSVQDWRYNTTGNFDIKFANQVGATLNVTNLQVVQGTNTLNAAQSLKLSPGASTTVDVSGLDTRATGTGYTVSVTITYSNLDTGFSGNNANGKCTGKIA